MKNHVLRISIDRHSTRADQSVITAVEKGLWRSRTRARDGVRGRVANCIVVCGEASRREEEDVVAAHLDEGWAFDGAFVCFAVVVEDDDAGASEHDAVV